MKMRHNSQIWVIRSVVPLVWSGAAASVDFYRSTCWVLQDARSSSAFQAVSGLTMLTWLVMEH